MYDDLIARLEAATEGSADLDYEIWNSLGTGPLKLSGKPRSIKRYTTSLDAALTLVPEREGGFEVDTRPHNGHGPSALVGIDRAYPAKFGTATTAPLALCIAALKARAISLREG